MDCRAFKEESKESMLYRLVYTYCVELRDEEDEGFIMNEEHSVPAWVDKKEIEDIQYSSLLKVLKDIIINRYCIHSRIVINYVM